MRGLVPAIHVLVAAWKTCKPGHDEQMYDADARITAVCRSV